MSPSEPSPTNDHPAARPARNWRTRVAIATPVLAAVVIAAVVLITTAGPTTPKASARAATSNASYTFTIGALITSAPQLNATFARLGIRERAIPVTASCAPADNTFTPPLMSADSKMRMSESITVSNTNIPAGWTGYLAAEQTPTGIRNSFGSTAAPLPACLSANEHPPVTSIVSTSSANSTATTGH